MTDPLSSVQSSSTGHSQHVPQLTLTAIQVGGFYSPISQMRKLRLWKTAEKCLNIWAKLVYLVMVL